MTCPNEITLSAYLDERLPEEERRGIEKHVSACGSCLDFLLVAYEVRRENNTLKGGLQNSWIPAFRLSHRLKNILKFKWFFGSFFFFILSFVFKHYFLQFLAVSVILGFKWVMEGEGARKAVMIFKGIEKKEKIFERKSPPPVSDIAGGDKYGENG
jgi:hypothetical protein